jgi:hypothetical protein
MEVLFGTLSKPYQLSLVRLYPISDRSFDLTQNRQPLILSLSKDEKYLATSKEASFDWLRTDGLLRRLKESRSLCYKQLVLHLRPLLNGGLIDDD